MFMCLCTLTGSRIEKVKNQATRRFMSSPRDIFWMEIVDATNDNGRFKFFFETYWKVQCTLFMCNYSLMFDAHECIKIICFLHVKCIFPDHKRCKIMVEWQIRGQSQKIDSKTTKLWSWKWNTEHKNCIVSITPRKNPRFNQFVNHFFVYIFFFFEEWTESNKWKQLLLENESKIICLIVRLPH